MNRLLLLALLLTACPTPPTDDDDSAPHIDCDADGDGVQSVECGGQDCDDTDPGVLPGWTDNDCDGVDGNCDGVVDTGCGDV